MRKENGSPGEAARTKGLIPFRTAVIGDINLNLKGGEIEWQ